MKSPSIDVSPDAASLAARCADWLIERLAASTGRFAINLSGGSTPKRLYELLATPAYRDRIDWPRVHVFFGDERYVPADHADSNYGMTRDALLAHVPIPTENVYPVATDLPTPEAAAEAYAATLTTYYGRETLDPSRPLFDVTLLGLGEDGHTASLFPGTDVLQERRKWVAAVIGAKPEPRITMTYPVLEASAETVFLVAGAGKREVLAGLLDHDPALPSSHVQPQGAFTIFCDEASRSKA